MPNPATHPQVKKTAARHAGAAPERPARSPAELREYLGRLRRRGNVRLGDALLALGSIDADELERSLAAKAEQPARLLGEVLEGVGIPHQAIQAALAFQLGVPAVDLREWPIERAVLALIPAETALAYRAVPVHLDGDVLFVAISDVLEDEALAALRLATPLLVRPVYASEADLRWVLETYYLTDETGPVSDEDLERATSEYAGEALSPEHAAASDNVIVRLANQIVSEARRERASDIHIEPMPERRTVRVRIRIDGRMYARRTIPWAYRHALTSRYKVMAGLNVAEHRIPQDGKILFRQSGSPPVELRVATLPTAGGVEDVVLRILDSSSVLPLSALGLGDMQHQRLRELIEQPYGILLVCGPTGSGKTTTLHAVLHQLNDGSRKIWTVENPVEITQSGLRQVEVNAHAGLTFANALRAFLRADPDVIMVGEIRDAETAKTALESSLTGHLVLSTLHTNNAPESIVRLVEMGMNPFNFSDSLLGVLAQRLVPCLCEACREPVEAADELLERLAEEHLSSVRVEPESKDQLLHEWHQRYAREGAIALYRPKGCPACASTGYKGRVGLFELMPASKEIKRLIIEGAGADPLFEVAQQQGMQTLKQDGIQKVLRGMTDLAHVLAASPR